MTTQVARHTRSDGERSRQAILATAARLASTHGIDRLSIGDLATEVGMSKSGLYAHFGSKEELQLATIDAAEDRHRPGVGPDQPDQAPDQRRLARAVGPEQAVHLAPPDAQVHAQPGPVKDRIAEFDGRWRGRLERELAAAKAAGDLPADEDIDEVVFDVDALLYYAHGAFSFRDDPAVLEAARRAVRRRLGKRGR